MSVDPDLVYGLEPEFLDTFLLLQISDRNYYYVNHFIYIKAIVTL